MERIFIPGSRWLFFKLYTGTQSADILLTRHISPFVRRLRESGGLITASLSAQWKILIL